MKIFLNLTSVSRSKRVILVATIALAMLGASSRFVAHAASSDDDPNGGKYAFGLWGDLPYTTPTSDIQATVGVPNLIADMNSAKTRIHRPRRRLEERLQRLHRRGLCAGALVLQLVPGACGLHARRQRLDGLRSSRERWLQLARTARQRTQLFFSTPFTLGQQPLRSGGAVNAALSRCERQPSPCVENRRWTFAASPTRR